METQTPHKPVFERLDTLDFVRGLSIVIMVAVHTLWMYGNVETQGQSTLGHALHMIGKGTAAFLVAMGVSLLLSRRQSIGLMFKRGLAILAIGYAMNWLKFVLPILLGTMPEAFIAAYGWEAPLSFGQYRYLVLTGDILQMAGFSLLILAGVLAVFKNAWSYLVLALLLASFSQIFRGWQPGIPGLDYLANVLFSDNYSVYFPIFPWLSCVLVGMFLSRRYLQHGSQDTLFKESLLLGTPLLIVGGALCMHNYAYHFSNFFHLGPGGIAYLTGLNLVGMWLVHHGLKRAKLTKIRVLFRYCSRHVTSLYLAQWVLICWGMGLIGFQTLNAWQTLAMIPVTLGLTLGGHYLVVKGLSKSPVTDQPSPATS